MVKDLFLSSSKSQFLKACEKTHVKIINCFLLKLSNLNGVNIVTLSLCFIFCAMFRINMTLF